MASSGVTKGIKDKGWLGLGASDSRQERYNAYIVQIKSEEQVQVYGLMYILWERSAEKAKEC